MQRIFFAAVLGVFVFVTNGAFATQPNPNVTPGSLCTAQNPDFDGFRYPSHVAHCKRHVTEQEKLQIAELYGGIPQSEWHNYEFDHLIPLNAGGDSSVANIWPEPLDEAHEKDKIEQEIYDGLANGSLTQGQAVKMMLDWVHQH